MYEYQDDFLLTFIKSHFLSTDVYSASFHRVLSWPLKFVQILAEDQSLGVRGLVDSLCASVSTRGAGTGSLIMRSLHTSLITILLLLLILIILLRLPYLLLFFL